ncbi:MAG: phosphoadenylyl-sulfate reductase [Actinomycetota bacterium]
MSDHVLLDEVEAGELSALYDQEPAQEVLNWALDRFHPRVALSAGGGAEGMALVDMAWRINPNVRVFTLDTGRLPQETYDLFERVRERYHIPVEVQFPDPSDVQPMVHQNGLNLMYESVDLRLKCCEVRKVLPMKRYLKDLDAWITGLRRDQWSTRAKIHKIEVDPDHEGIVKVNPLADWDKQQVWDYIHEHDVPYHALLDQGYTSIGCAPCTRAVKRGEDERAGRWWWESGTEKECGIHCSVQVILGEGKPGQDTKLSSSDGQGGK